MKRITKIILGVGALGGVGIAGLFGYVLYDGPRMKVQPHLRAYQWQMALPPPGAVPAGPPPVPHPTVPASGGERGAAERGAVYYSYYCLFCHGSDGRGRGPVGESYYPAPPDLTRVNLPPADLQVAMLTGVGHSPVLERVVRPEYRQDLVAYLQTLMGSRGGTTRGR